MPVSTAETVRRSFARQVRAAARGVEVRTQTVNDYFIRKPVAALTDSDLENLGRAVQELRLARLRHTEAIRAEEEVAGQIAADAAEHVGP